MTLEISEETKVRVLANARAQGLEVDDYLRRLMLEAEAQSEFVSAVEEGLAGVEGGRIRPMREALSQLGAKGPRKNNRSSVVVTATLLRLPIPAPFPLSSRLPQYW